MELYDRIMAEEHELFAWESHQLRATSPDGARAMWLLHDVVSRGPTWHERTIHVQLLVFERDGRTRVARADHRWTDMHRLFRGPQFEGPSGRFEPGATRGSIAGASWDLVSAGGLPPIRHLPHDFLYGTSRSNNKLVTPQPCLKVAGVLDLNGDRWELEGWVGARSHLWGPGPGRETGWLACHRWDDGEQRALEGFVGKAGFGLGQVAVMVVKGPESAHWIRRGELVGTPPSELRSSRGGYAVSARAGSLISLRSPSPAGDMHRRVSPFAAVELTTPNGVRTSQCGGLEFLEDVEPPDHVWPAQGYLDEPVFCELS